MVCILTPHLIAAVDPIHLEVPPTARPLRRALHCVFKQTTDHVVTPRWSVDQVREQAAQVPVPDLQIRRALRADVSLRDLVHAAARSLGPLAHGGRRADGFLFQFRWLRGVRTGVRYSSRGVQLRSRSHAFSVLPPGVLQA